jgi:peroxiredoxin Q/BCP
MFRSLAARFAAPSVALTAALVVASSAYAEVKVGDAAPDFTLKDQDGQEVKLGSFKGQKNVLLAFYVKDASPQCMAELKVLVKEQRRLASHDFVTLAVGVDPVESHSELAKRIGAKFRMLADTDLAVARLFDVYLPSAGGATAARSAFLVDKEGKVRWFDRSMKAVATSLDGTDLLAQIEKVGGKTDPVAALAELPQAERDGKTAFVRFAQALLAEDPIALDAILDPEACGKPGEPPQMQRDRRKALVDRWRAVFDKNDLKALGFDDTIDVRGTRVLTKEGATAAVLTGFSADARDVASRLAEGELLVVGRTSNPKAGDTVLLAREYAMRVRQRDGAWKIVEIVP